MSAASMSRQTITAYLRLYLKNLRKKELVQQRVKRSVQTQGQSLLVTNLKSKAFISLPFQLWKQWGDETVDDLDTRISADIMHYLALVKNINWAPN